MDWAIVYGVFVIALALAAVIRLQVMLWRDGYGALDLFDE